MPTDNPIEILLALAHGIDPKTGEVLPPQSPYQNPDVIRALFDGIRALEEKERIEINSSSKRKLDENMPARAGQAWDDREAQQLMEQFDKGAKISQIAQLHQRTPGAIRSRLVRLGKIEDPSLADSIPKENLCKNKSMLSE